MDSASDHLVGLNVALLARLTWARSILLGTHVHFMTMFVLLFVARPDGLNSPVPAIVMLPLPVIVFLMPWRRRELYPAGYALCLLSFAFVGTVSVPWCVVSTALVGTVPALFAIARTIMRAKWAALAAAVTGVVLFVSTIETVLPQTSMLLASMAAAVIVKMQARQA